MMLRFKEDVVLLKRHPHATARRSGHYEESVIIGVTTVEEAFYCFIGFNCGKGKCYCQLMFLEVYLVLILIYASNLLSYWAIFYFKL